MKRRQTAVAATPSIRTRLLGYFAFFMVFVLLVIWAFQILLVDRFYESAKRSELEDAGKLLEHYIDADDFTQIAYNVAARYGVCVLVRPLIHEKLGASTADYDNSSACYIHHVASETLVSLCEKARDNGGEYMTFTPTLTSLPVTYSDNGEAAENRSQGSEVNRLPRGKNVILVKLAETTDGVEYAIFLNSELQPMTATVSTLTIIFIWIAGALLVGALIMTAVFSSRIVKPLSQMNAAAKRLGAGDYNTKFEGEGYRETLELAETLNSAADQIRRSDELQKELLANVSHDLRTPLTLIKGYAEVMRDIPGENTPENVQTIIDESERLAELVADMMEVSTVRAGTRTPSFEVFDFTALVREVMARYKKLVERDGLIMSFKAEREVYVRADRIMILQVVYNLINNAVNYCGEDRTVIVLQSESDGRVRLSVIDHGVGIPEDKIPMIWDRYYKIDKVHRRASVGSGLGLSIVKGVLQAHGAEFGVESSVGHGSNFWFELDETEPDDAEN